MASNIAKGMEQYKAMNNTAYGVTNAMRSNMEELRVKRNDAWQKSYSKLMCMLAAVLGSAEAEMIDMRSMIKESRYYRQQVKQNVNRLNTQFLENFAEGFLRLDTSHGVFYDIMDSCTETLQPDVTKLYYSIKNEMDRQGNPDSAIKAKVYMVSKLVELSCYVYDAHVGIGPDNEEGISPENEKMLRSAIIKASKGESCRGEHYDYLYDCAMKDARPTALKAMMLAIQQGVCGTWSHISKGNVQSALDAIMIRVTSAHWLDKVVMRGVASNDGYEEEVKLLQKLSFINRGEIAITIDLLEAVQCYLAGMTDEEIERKVFPDKDKIHEERRKRTMSIINLIRLCELNSEGYEYLNELNKVWDESGYEAAKEYHLKTHERLKKSIENNSEEQQTLVQKKPTEQERMAQMLSEKFGNVKIQGEKKPKKPATAAPLKLTPQPPERKKTSRRWTNEEELYLVSEVQKGISLKSIAMMLRRTESAVYQKYLRISKRPKQEPPTINFSEK